MTSMVSQNISLNPPDAQGTHATLADHVAATRRRLALRSALLDGSHPEALDLEARLLVALRLPTLGMQNILACERDETHLRAALRGDRQLHESEVARILTSKRQEARQAAYDYAAEVADSQGCRLAPKAGAESELHMAIAAFDHAASRVRVHGVSALSPESEGGADVTEMEAVGWLELLRHAKEAFANLEHNVSRALDRARAAQPKS